ncbi:ribosomal RNA small subunit methyltransferase G [Jannaschia pagri]|uniref:Ribosomal RNA small subunit methyltransferase G n=1 Tax=Jannaschia pagri TaxID=2829797 RepID=A0ABQ4NLK1_9RHOB|nr:MULTISPECIES: 16S rRNA (guanine(527)-N(7))-methyltransferase RsmG [unclassified Jannaschia]GIT91451.1 ribosomal RNA small subunit methyltransferase G [Jannaschia sp. AI_61]GIT95285.1 ribosomal RNA small subunit methyltransferase G [Jannaschia sp. AI_62]
MTIDLPDVSRETLEAYLEMLMQWNETINLIGPSTIATAWDRHILDSVPMAEAIDRPAANWVDLGSGGGLPGVVIAILRPDCAVTLVESDLRKATFLRSVRRQLDLSFDVVSKRIEKCPPFDADVISARALASLSKLMDYAQPHIVPDGTLIFAKGAKWQAEHIEAQASWTYDLDVVSAADGSDGAILKITNLRARYENS